MSDKTRDPTPEEIKKRSALIRKEWSPDEAGRREAVKPQEWSVPGASSEVDEPLEGEE